MLCKLQCARTRARARMRSAGADARVCANACARIRARTRACACLRKHECKRVSTCKRARMRGCAHTPTRTRTLKNVRTRPHVVVVRHITEKFGMTTLGDYMYQMGALGPHVVVARHISEKSLG